MAKKKKKDIKTEVLIQDFTDEEIDILEELIENKIYSVEMNTQIEQTEPKLIPLPGIPEKYKTFKTLQVTEEEAKVYTESPRLKLLVDAWFYNMVAKDELEGLKTVAPHIYKDYVTIFEKTKIGRTKLSDFSNVRQIITAYLGETIPEVTLTPTEIQSILSEAMYGDRLLLDVLKETILKSVHPEKKKDLASLGLPRYSFTLNFLSRPDKPDWNIYISVLKHRERVMRPEIIIVLLAKTEDEFLNERFNFILYGSKEFGETYSPYVSYAQLWWFLTRYDPTNDAFVERLALPDEVEYHFADTFGGVFPSENWAKYFELHREKIGLTFRDFDTKVIEVGRKGLDTIADEIAALTTKPRFYIGIPLVTAKALLETYKNIIIPKLISSFRAKEGSKAREYYENLKRIRQKYYIDYRLHGAEKVLKIRPLREGETPQEFNLNIQGASEAYLALLYSSIEEKEKGLLPEAITDKILARIRNGIMDEFRQRKALVVLMTHLTFPEVEEKKDNVAYIQALTKKYRIKAPPVKIFDSVLKFSPESLVFFYPGKYKLTLYKEWEE